MQAKVFISYRRDDSAGHAGRVHDRLEREFGRDLLFMDVDAMPLGANFVKVLGEEVGKCDVLLAIIGPGWLDARDDDGKRRLENPYDFVRIEIATALKRDIPVIPILLEGIRVPKSEQLPDDLKELSLRNGLDVRHASFHNDMNKLIGGLKSLAAAPASSTERNEADGRHHNQVEIEAPMADKGEATKSIIGGARKPLSLQQTVESGYVRQNFSRGRSKTVQVEVVRKPRKLTDPDGSK